MLLFVRLFVSASGTGSQPSDSSFFRRVLTLQPFVGHELLKKREGGFMTATRRLSTFGGLFLALVAPNLGLTRFLPAVAGIDPRYLREVFWWALLAFMLLYVVIAERRFADVHRFSKAELENVLFRPPGRHSGRPWHHGNRAPSFQASGCT
jgi:hypothetical protein